MVTNLYDFFPLNSCDLKQQDFNPYLKLTVKRYIIMYINKCKIIMYLYENGIMATQTLLTSETVSITDFRKHPAEYFGDTPVAVLSNNKPKGYVIGAEMFEQLMALAERAAPGVKAQFNPTAKRLTDIAARGAELLTGATDEELGDFTEA